MIADWALPAPTCGEPETRSWIIADVHYLHFAILLFGLSIIIIWAVSVMTEPPSEILVCCLLLYLSQQFSAT